MTEKKIKATPGIKFFELHINSYVCDREHRATAHRATGFEVNSSNEEMRVIMSGVLKGNRYLADEREFPCPYCKSEAYKKYMKRMDYLESVGEITVERGEDAKNKVIFRKPQARGG